MPFIAQGVRTPLNLEVAIIGDGTRSLALGSILSMVGHKVRLWSTEGSAPQECEIRQRHAQVGQIRKKTNFSSITNNLAAAINGASLVVLSSPASNYAHIVSSIIDHLQNGQTIVLSNSPLGALLQFHNQIKILKPGLQVNVLEMGSLYDSVRIEGNVVLAAGPRQRISICGKTRNETRRGLNLVSYLWSGLVPASNVLERGLSEVERILAPILHLFHLISAPPDAKHAGVTDALQAVVSGIEAEVQSVARAFKLSVSPFGQVLQDYWGATGDSLAERISSVEPLLLKFDGNESSPLALQQEFCETLVLVESLARLARLQVPVLDAVIRIASTATGCDLQSRGRNINDLGLVGLEVHDIVEMINQ